MRAVETRGALLALFALAALPAAAQAQSLDLNRASEQQLSSLIAFVAYTSQHKAVNAAYCAQAARKIVAGRPIASVGALLTRKLVSKSLYPLLAGRVTVTAVTPTPTPTTPSTTGGTSTTAPSTSTANDLPFPRRVDLTAQQSPVRNQARRNTCNSFATTAGMESFDKTLDLSEQLLYYLLRDQDADKAKCLKLKYDAAKPNLCDDECSGATLEDSVKVLQRIGLYAESVWSYDRTDNLTPGVSCVESATWASKYVSYEGKKRVKLGSVVWLAEPGASPKNKRVDDPMVLMAILAKGYAVNVAMDCAGGGWDTGMNIDVELDPATHKPMKPEGGHAVLLVGYDYDRKAFKFKNSWDTDWGEAGYGWVTFDYLKQYVYGGYYATGIVK